LSFEGSQESCCSDTGGKTVPCMSSRHTERSVTEVATSNYLLLCKSAFMSFVSNAHYSFHTTLIKTNLHNSIMLRTELESEQSMSIKHCSWTDIQHFKTHQIS